MSRDRFLREPDYYAVDPTGIEYHDRGVLRCDCGARIEMYDAMTNSCDRCPREYNGSGSLLAPRECWGEETGEHWIETTRPWTDDE